MLHIGGVRTALFSWLHARRHGGRFILRVEDTDRERSTEESIQAILAGLEWVGLDYDEGPIRQTDRFERYAAVAESMLRAGTAYHCYCSKDDLDARRAAQVARGENPRYDGRCRSRTAPVPGVRPIVRLRNPDEGSVTVHDLVRGDVTFDNADLDDLILVRPDGVPQVLVASVSRGTRVLTGRTLMEAAGLPYPAVSDAPLSPEEFRRRVETLYEAMRDAMRRGDWAGVGAAWEALGRVLRATRQP